VVRLGDTAFGLDERPHDALELFVFIEGYAHVGEWEGALELSRRSQEVSEAELRPLLCLLWERIEMETTEGSVEGAKRSAALAEVRSMFSCNP